VWRLPLSYGQIFERLTFCYFFLLSNHFLGQRLLFRKTTRKSSHRWTSLPPGVASKAVAVAGKAALPIKVSPVSFSVARQVSADTRILGLDPGSLVTGYAVIDCVRGKTQYQTSGCIRTQGDSLAARLAEIFAAVTKLTAEWHPQEVSIERVFMHRNADSALKLGQARGAALCGTFASGAPVFEYAPREIKQAVVGTGAAQKEQVQMMVTQLLKLNAEQALQLKADAADALAVAVCHAHSRQLNKLLGAAR
jgi:crossover junction endodeoxyribonuclease RuvC